MAAPKRSHGAKARTSSSARALASARGTRNTKRTQTIVAAVVVVVVAVAVIGGVLYANSQKRAQHNAIIDVSKTQANFPVRAAHGVVVAGKASAPITIDAYEDFICPVCGEFFQIFEKNMNAQMADGHLQVRYHMLNFLDQNSNPPGYSGRAAAASLAVAHDAPDKWSSYYKSLYEQQPKEGSAGYSNAQLISLGKRLGIEGQNLDRFTRDVTSGTYVGPVHKDLQTAVAKLSKKRKDGRFGTPTIVHDGHLVTWQSSGKPVHWLQKLLKQNNLR
jgi:protein-disulfide isomerase